MDQIIKDLKYAARSLFRYPTFTIVAVMTLALGIGANTAIFTVVNAVLLRPLPYPNAERLMMVGLSTPSTKFFRTTRNRFLYWREQSLSFAGLTTFRTSSAPLVNGNSGPRDVEILRVSEDFFDVLAVKPQTGRTFFDEEKVAGGPGAAIITDRFWKGYFGSAADVVGRSLTLNEVSYTVIGVMPESFWFEVETDVITPLQLGTTRELFAGGANYPVVGRLKPGVTQDQALGEMKVIAQQFVAAYPEQRLIGESVSIVGYQEFMVGEIKLPLMILLSAVAFVLVIACANVANLQLSRAVTRGREIAIRAAMGATRWRVVRQLLSEGLLLSCVGGVVGLLLAVWGVAAFEKFIPVGLLPRADQIGFSAEVFFFTTIISVLAGLIFGLAPALHSTRVDLSHALKESSTTGSHGIRHGRFRSVLVVSQVSLALVLLIGATLMIRTFANLRSVDPGFDSAHLLTFEVSLRGPRYETTAQMAEFNQRAIERLSALPGVENVATTNTLPLRRWLNLPLEFEGKPDQIVSAEWRMISGDYFDTMKMRVTKGRNIAHTDTNSAPGVVVVNEAFARRHLKDVSALGQRIVIGKTMGEEFARPVPLEVVGVVSDSKQVSLKEPASPTVYVPTAQVPNALMDNFRSFYFVTRTVGDPVSYADSVRREMLALDNQLLLRNIRAMDEVLLTSISAPRFHMLLLALFGAIGLVLSAVGIYGVMAYTVSQRTREIGIRMALGAQIKDVLRLVLGHGMKLAVLGVIIGLGVAFALTRVLEKLLFEVKPTDLTTFVVVSLVFIAVALLACYLPARRATKVDPIETLRYE
jgi:predicted permease